MPLPIPFYLRDNQTIPLTHAQLDGNFTILNSKIDNTTCTNIGTGVGIFESKQTGTNDGIMNLYSLSGTNGISVGISGNTLVIDGGGAADSDWVTNGDNIYNGNSGSVSIGTTGVFNVGGGGNDTKLQTSAGISGVPFTGLPISTTAVFESDTTNAISLFSPDANLSEIYFGTPSDVFGAFLRWDYTTKEFTLSTANVSGKTIFKTSNGVEAARINENGLVGINTLENYVSGTGVKLHISGGTYNEGRLTVTDSISLPDNSKLLVGTSSDLQIYHDGLNSYIGEVGTGSLLISGREIWLSDGVTGNPYLRTNSPQSELSLFWSSETRIQTTEDGVKIHGTSSGTSVASLALRADGTIITGNTVPLGQSIDVNASADPNVFGYNTVNYTATSPGGTIYIGDSSLLPTGFQVKLIRTASTTAADIGAGGGSTINGSGTKALPTALYSVVTCTANTNVWYCSTGTVL